MQIVMIPFHDYKKWRTEGFRTRDAHLCRHLEASDRVTRILVVNRPVSLAELWLKGRPWRTEGGQTLYADRWSRLSRQSEKVYCLDCFLPELVHVAAERKAWWFRAFRSERVLARIRRAMETLGMEDSLLLLQNPMAIGAAENLGCRRFVFDAIDNWLYHPQMPDKALIRKNYDYVKTHADGILTVSEALAAFFAENGNVQWVPNGVDPEFFALARRKNQGGKRVVGYTGKIQERVDFDLVEECLNRFPEAEFRFLGPIYGEKKRISQLKERYSNIRFLGDIPYDRLPEAMAEFDLAILPHKVDDFTESMNPLKLYEYLAAGKPVVTTAVAGTAGLSEYVYAGASREEFLALLGETMEDLPDPEAVAASIPEEYTWSRITERVLDFLENC